MKNKITVFSLTVVAFLLLTLNDCNNQENILPLTKSWEKIVPHQEIPEGLTSLNADYCGACHADHYEEWKYSTHAHAWNDLQFQAELKKESSPFMCINCHVPLQNQQEYIIEGLVDGDIYKPVKRLNPKFDKKLQSEGITCVSCHLRENAIVGTTGSKSAPHKTIKDEKFLSETLCISCHNAVAVVTPTLACSFETGDEWKAGPYFGEKNCKSCHMETVEREIVRGFGKKQSHYHFFEGSGIPKFDTVETKIKNGLEFYPSEFKKRISIKDSLRFSIKLKNEHAGHKVPTGDPERFINTTFILLSTNGDTLRNETHRIGEHWEWYPEVKKISDNNLLPNEERTYEFRYKPTKSEKLILKVIVTKHRLNQKSADYNKLKSNYPLFITIFEKEYETWVK